jgi:hypothetical protein
MEITTGFTVAIVRDATGSRSAAKKSVSTIVSVLKAPSLLIPLQEPFLFLPNA